MKHLSSILAVFTFIAALPAINTYAAGELPFTHNEWTGRNGSEDIFAVNREDASVNAVHYADIKSAVNAVWEYDARTESSYFQKLTGKGQKWELNVVQNSEKAQHYLDSGFMNPDYHPSQTDGWKTVELPKSWTCQGFDFPIYSNISQPWQIKYDSNVSVPNAPVNYNPVGLYRHKFTLDSSITGSGRRISVQFDGVESAYYLYVNGKEVGYSEDTFSPHRFDITDYLVNGENTIAVEVHKFCDGTWFEDQDMIYDGGIFRDVYLVSAPDVQIRDYTVRTDLDDSYKNAVLSVEADIRSYSGSLRNGWIVQADAYDESGKNILSGASAQVDQNGKCTIETKVSSPALWSAEDPNIYALVLTLKDSSGNVMDIVSSQLGFREIGFTPTEVDRSYKVTTKNWDPITINGKRLLLKGVNRHDTDPFNGKAVPQDTIREDILLMQKNNINAIRTSHYSNDSYLYWLCNKYGMYIMGETNMESHALMNDNDGKALFYELAMDRTKTAYQRLKNEPSIIAWSIGNEMAYTGDPSAAGGMFRDMIWYFKKNDGTRPVHSEGQGSGMGVDMGSNMYPGSDVIGYNAGNGKIPYVMCEYDHAMGNSLGALKEYWDVIRSSENMLGGFIWDWVDQSRAVPVKAGWDYYSEEYAHKNLYADDTKGKYFAYGGDWGDFPNDNSFCENGIISPDRTEQPEAAEVRYQYQSFWFSADASQLAKHKVSVYNENNFTDLSEFDVEWSLLKNGISIDSGKLTNVSAAPLRSTELSVPFELPESCLAGDEYCLDLSVVTRKQKGLLPKDTEIAYGQIALNVSGTPVHSDTGSGEITLVEHPDYIIPTGKDFNFTIDRNTGLMASYSYKGKMLINNGPTPEFWRGYVENDNNAGYNKLFDTAWQHAADRITVDRIETGSEDGGKKTVTSYLTLPDAGNTKVTIKYTISPDGCVKIDTNVDATRSGLGNFLRVGSIMTLPEGCEQISWYGNGPVETFSDRKTCGRSGVWENTVSGMFYPYMKADDTGTLTDVRWIAVRNESNDSGILVSADGTIEASALHFTPDDLMKADHVYKLVPRKETILSLNYGSMGTGSATCGQGTLEKYRLPSSRTYDWSYTIVPIAEKTSNEQLSSTAAKLRSDSISFKDLSHNGLSVPIGNSAKLKNNNGENAVSGSIAIPPCTELEKCLSGKNSFTIEVDMIQTGTPEFNMFAGKGDYAFGLRTRSGALDFFVHAGGAWRSLYCDMPTDYASGWLGRRHQVAGVYDAENNTISVYADGTLIGSGSTNTTTGVTESAFPLTLGACPETGRSSETDFYSFRVYSKALTGDELIKQKTASPAYSPESQYVQLWLDFDETSEPLSIGDTDLDGDVDINDLEKLEGFLLNKNKLAAASSLTADMNGDGIVNAFDMILLRKVLS